jgi:hypothetical protein
MLAGCQNQKQNAKFRLCEPNKALTLVRGVHVCRPTSSVSRFKGLISSPQVFGVDGSAAPHAPTVPGPDRAYSDGEAISQAIVPFPSNYLKLAWIYIALFISVFIAENALY